MKLLVNPYRPEHKRFFGCSGDRIRVKNTLKYDDHGNMSLVKVGELDIVDHIQSFAESCDIDMLVRRYERGDVTALNKRVPVYGDVSFAPENPADFYNASAVTRRFFEKNAKIFEKYNGDYSKFIADINTPDGFAALFGKEKEVNTSGDDNEQKQ